LAVRLLTRKKQRTDEGENVVILPNVCPACDGSGYLDHINLVRETKTQTCQDCGHRWESKI
jgi:DnaJ-class molecular chaperone